MASPANSAARPPATGETAHGRGNMSVKGAALWAAASQYCLFALQFFTSVIISRFFLLPEEVGLFSVALAAAMLLSIIQDFGLTRYIGGHPTADEETIRSCTVIAIIFAFLLVVLIGAISWPVATFYNEPRLGPILLLIAASFLFVPWSIVPLALINRRLDFKRTFAVNISGALAYSVAALTLAALDFSAESLAWAMIAQTMTRSVVAQIAQPTPVRLPLRVRDLRDILGFGSASTVLYFSGGIGMRTPDMIVDTGSGTSVGNRALQNALARRGSVSGTVNLMSVTGQSITADLGVAKKLGIRNVSITNLIIAFTDTPAFTELELDRKPALFLGMRELRLFKRVAVDFGKRRVMFDLPKLD